MAIPSATRGRRSGTGTDYGQGASSNRRTLCSGRRARLIRRCSTAASLGDGSSRKCIRCGGLQRDHDQGRIADLSVDRKPSYRTSCTGPSGIHRTFLVDRRRGPRRKGRILPTRSIARPRLLFPVNHPNADYPVCLLLPSKVCDPTAQSCRDFPVTTWGELGSP